MDVFEEDDRVGGIGLVGDAHQRRDHGQVAADQGAGRFSGREFQDSVGAVDWFVWFFRWRWEEAGGFGGHHYTPDVGTSPGALVLVTQARYLTDRVSTSIVARTTGAAPILKTTRMGRPGRRLPTPDSHIAADVSYFNNASPSQPRKRTLIDCPESCSRRVINATSANTYSDIASVRASPPSHTTPNQSNIP